MFPLIRKCFVNRNLVSLTKFGSGDVLPQVHNGVRRCYKSWTLSATTETDNTSTTTRNVAEPDLLVRQLELEMRGHDTAVLKSYEWFIREAAKHLDIPVHKSWIPLTHFERRTILKSVFVHRKHLVQYELRTNFRVIQLKHLTGSTASTFLEYIERNLPEGVSLKVTKHVLEKLPEYTKPQSTETTTTSKE